MPAVDNPPTRAISSPGQNDNVHLIAGSHNDVNNLSIAVTANALKPDIFVVARQNHAANNSLFAAYGADFTMLPSRIVAQECIAILTTPLLAQFLELLRQQDEAWSQALGERLQTLCDGLTPSVWGIDLNISEAQSAWKAQLWARGLTR